MLALAMFKMNVVLAQYVCINTELKRHVAVYCIVKFGLYSVRGLHAVVITHEH